MQTVVPKWQEKVVYSAEGPQPQPLIATEKLKSVLVGLEAGQKIPPHVAPAAVYHFLEGQGWMVVEGERFPVEAGSTVIAPAGTKRGVDAITRLAFLGTHSGEGS